MKLIDFFTSGKSADPSEQPESFGDALSLSFTVLFHNDGCVKRAIADVLADTEGYCKAHEEAFDERSLQYDEEAEPWLQLIAGVDAALEQGYVYELDYKEGADEFRTALEAVLAANGIAFSLKRLRFAEDKAIPDWAAQFNQYAGQSGITAYAIDIDSDSYVLGAAHIGDYARAAEIAGEVGIKISARLD